MTADELHDFEACVTWHSIGRGRTITYRVVFLPAELAQRLPVGAQGRCRAQGEIEEQPFEAAWQPAGDGRYFMMLSQELLRNAGAEVGDLVQVRFRLVDASRVAVPDDLAAVFGRDPQVQAAWEHLTPGKRRGLVHQLESAKTAATRHKRLLQVLDLLLG
ncbi:YdeI/OmpD-associated family protein [Deinococcus sp.]|uniref:YdeI/OmpD-associated family protein n=1 Tax=Deinococcus sp. TaxID=47478 RepID=UPI003CC6819F